jgi:hypothetical protein
VESNSDFKVYISGPSSTEDEWGRALNAPVAQLPPLSDEERETAKRYGGSGEEYRRSKLAGAYSEERLRSKAKVIGERAQEILSRWASDCRLEAVSWQGSKLRWVLRIIEAEKKTATVSIPAELGDDIVDARSEQDVERLKNLVLFGVGRQELIFKH